jgi:hypothetical protein
MMTHGALQPIETNVCSCTLAAMTSDGRPYSRFHRALRTRNLDVIRAAAAELPNVSLLDALAIVEVIRARQPDAFDRAAVRWLGRFATERPAVRLEAVAEATDAFVRLGKSASATNAVETLRGLCR